VLESPDGGATLVACLFATVSRHRAGKEGLPWLTALIEHCRRGAMVAGGF
jgi:hypothetical protein